MAPVDIPLFAKFLLFIQLDRSQHSNCGPAKDQKRLLTRNKMLLNSLEYIKLVVYQCSYCL